MAMTPCQRTIELLDVSSLPRSPCSVYQCPNLAAGTTWSNPDSADSCRPGMTSHTPHTPGPPGDARAALLVPASRSPLLNAPSVVGQRVKWTKRERGFAQTGILLWALLAYCQMGERCPSIGSLKEATRYTRSLIIDSRWYVQASYCQYSHTFNK